MSINYPYVVEYEADNNFTDGVSHNSMTNLNEPGASDLFELIAQSPRVRWARWFKVGEAGDINEYWRA